MLRYFHSKEYSTNAEDYSMHLYVLTWLKVANIYCVLTICQLLV